MSGLSVTVSMGRPGTYKTVAVAGELDVAVASEFSQTIMGLHDIVGTEARYDFEAVTVPDAAGRSTLEMVAHKFREFGHQVTLPPSLDPLLPSRG